MPITRNKDQKSQSLIEFYQEAKDIGDEFSANYGELMLTWINEINSQFKTTEIWGLTSHYRLILQNENDWTSPAFVVLIASYDEYHLEYLIPEDDQPWENACVKGATKSIDTAMEMLKVAMKKSTGWVGSAELDAK